MMRMRLEPVLLSLLVVSAAAAPMARAQAADPHDHAAGEPTPGPAPGEQIKDFSVQTLTGSTQPVVISKTQPTVILFFSSGCPVCRRMLPIWNEQLTKKPKNLTVLGLLTDREPPEFFNMFPVSFPVVRASRELMASFKVARVPMTIRIKPGGIVESTAVGILDPIKLGEMFRP
jgi:thiol-disulfide isomerase/thioredoxin